MEILDVLTYPGDTMLFVFAQINGQKYLLWNLPVRYVYTFVDGVLTMTSAIYSFADGVLTI